MVVSTSYLDPHAEWLTQLEQISNGARTTKEWEETARAIDASLLKTLDYPLFWCAGGLAWASLTCGYYLNTKWYHLGAVSFFTIGLGVFCRAEYERMKKQCQKANQKQKALYEGIVNQLRRKRKFWFQRVTCRFNDEILPKLRLPKEESPIEIPHKTWRQKATRSGLVNTKIEELLREEWAYIENLDRLSSCAEQLNRHNLPTSCFELQEVANALGWLTTELFACDPNTLGFSWSGGDDNTKRYQLDWEYCDWHQSVPEAPLLRDPEYGLG